MKHYPLLAVAAAVLGACRSQPPAPAPRPAADTESVGRRGTNRTVLPVNQVVTPLGIQVELPGLRPQALALSPDGALLVTAGKTAELVVVDPATGAVRQRVPLPKTKGERRASSGNILQPDKEGQISYTGLRFSPDGRRAFLSDVNGSVVVFDVARDGAVRVARSLVLPPADAPRRKEEIPAGLAVSPDGSKLYVCGNLSNTLLELAVADGRVLRAFDVGVAPYDVVLAGGKAYVSNWGGRRPRPGEPTGPAGRGTVVKVDPLRHVASEGSVTVDRPRPREGQGRDRDRPSRERSRRVAGRGPRRGRKRRERHPERDRHRGRTPWSRRSGRSRARPISSARSPTRWPSTPPAARSTSRTARRTPWPSWPSTRESASRG